MRAVDTNVLVRFLTADDAVQYRHARTVMEGGAVQIAKTVLLETEWVLRRAYGFSPSQVHWAIHALLNAAGVEVEDEDRVAQALNWYGHGMDFADALHLCSRGSATEFLTFDKQLIAAARKAEIKGVRTPTS
jgi:predicted nucleic-acid-binding protein